MIENNYKRCFKEKSSKKIYILFFLIFAIGVIIISNLLINIIEFGVIATFNTIKNNPIPDFSLMRIILTLNTTKPYSYFYIITITIFSIIGTKYIYKIRRSFKTLNKGQHGDSRFTTLKEIKNQYKEIPEKTVEYEGDGGVVISRYKDKLYIDDGPVNNLIIGTTRSGKGENFIFPTIDALSRAENKPSMVLNDPKGELVSASYDVLKERGYNIEILNILEPERGMQYNPLNLIIESYKNGEIEESVSLCNTLSYSIFKSEENTSRDSFWSDASISLVNACIFAVTDECIRNKEEHKITMFTVANLLNELSGQSEKQAPGKKPISKLDKYFDSFPPSSPARLQYATFKFTEGKTRASVLSFAMSKLQIFTLTDIAKMTSRQSYDFKNVGFNTRDRYSLFLHIKDSRLNSILDEEKISLKYIPNDGLYSEKEELEKLKSYLKSKELDIKFLIKSGKEIIKPLFTTENLSAIMLKEYSWDYNKTKLILNRLYNNGFINDPRYTSIYLQNEYKNQFNFILEKLKRDSNYSKRAETILENTILSHSTRLDKDSRAIIDKKFIRQTNDIGLHPLKTFNDNELLREEEKLVMKIITERFLQFLDEPKDILNFQIYSDKYMNFKYSKIFTIDKEELPKSLIDYLLKLNPNHEEDNDLSDIEKIKNILEDKQIKKDLKEEKIKFNLDIKEEFSNAPVAIFMVTPDFDKSKHVLASMFTKQLYYVLIKESNLSDKQKTDRTVHFILDEFGSMPKIDAMDNTITVCLSRNIRFSLVVQSYSQLEEVYGSAGNTIKENCGNTIYILTTDYDTADDISRRCGNKTMEDYSRTGQHLSVDKSETEDLKQERLILADNLLRLEQDNTIVLRPIKRTDLKGNKIVPYAIYNTGELSMTPRWQYLLDEFPQGININQIINKAYKDKLEVYLNDLIYLPEIKEL